MCVALRTRPRTCLDTCPYTCPHTSLCTCLCIRIMLVLGYAHAPKFRSLLLYPGTELNDHSAYIQFCAHVYIHVYAHICALVMHTSIVMPILMSHTVCMYGHVHGHAHGQVRGRVHGHGQESRWLTIRLPTAPLLCSARYLCRPVCRNVYIHVCRQVQTCEWMIATVCVAVRGSVHACVCRHVCRDA